MNAISYPPTTRTQFRRDTAPTANLSLPPGVAAISTSTRLLNVGVDPSIDPRGFLSFLDKSYLDTQLGSFYPLTGGPLQGSMDALGHVNAATSISAGTSLASTGGRVISSATTTPSLTAFASGVGGAGMWTDGTKLWFGSANAAGNPGTAYANFDTSKGFNALGLITAGAGLTVTAGATTLAQDPINPMEAVTKRYIDGGRFVPQLGASNQVAVVENTNKAAGKAPVITGYITPNSAAEAYLQIQPLRLATADPTTGSWTDGAAISLRGPSFTGQPNTLALYTGGNAGGYHQWYFDAAGNLTTPGALVINGVTPGGSPLIGGGTSAAGNGDVFSIFRTINGDGALIQLFGPNALASNTNAMALYTGPASARKYWLYQQNGSLATAGAVNIPANTSLGVGSGQYLWGDGAEGMTLNVGSGNAYFARNASSFMWYWTASGNAVIMNLDNGGSLTTALDLVAGRSVWSRSTAYYFGNDGNQSIGISGGWMTFQLASGYYYQRNANNGTYYWFDNAVNFAYITPAGVAWFKGGIQVAGGDCNFGASNVYANNLNLAYLGNWISAYINQPVLTTSNPTFNMAYLTGGFVNQGYQWQFLWDGQPHLWMSGADRGYILTSKDYTLIDLALNGNGYVYGTRPSSAGQVWWPITWSDRRLKSNIVDAADAMPLLRGIPVHELDLTPPSDDPQAVHKPYSFIADEIEALLPGALGPRLKPDDYATVEEGVLIAALWKAAQQMDTRLTALEGATR